MSALMAKTLGILSDLIKVVKTTEENTSSADHKVYEALTSIYNHSTSEYHRLKSLLSPDGRPSAKPQEIDA